MTMKSKSASCSVVSDSLRPQRRLAARLLCPWDSLGKNIGVDCQSHSLYNSNAAPCPPPPPAKPLQFCWSEPFLASVSSRRFWMSVFYNFYFISWCCTAICLPVFLHFSVTLPRSQGLCLIKKFIFGHWMKPNPPTPPKELSPIHVHIQIWHRYTRKSTVWR